MTTSRRPDELARIDAVMALVRGELIKATNGFGSFNSGHEGYAVIREELDEMWDEVKANRPDRAGEEAVQVAAMGARFVLDLALPYLTTDPALAAS